MSIDALEQETGIDFFHNLPDNIENTVEATYNVNDWQDRKSTRLNSSH